MFIGEFACMFAYLLTLTALFKGISNRISSYFADKQKATSPPDADVNYVESTNSTPVDSESAALLSPDEEKQNTRYTNRNFLYHKLTLCSTIILDSRMLRFGWYNIDECWIILYRCECLSNA
jgi:hypothetical protein